MKRKTASLAICGQRTLTDDSVIHFSTFKEIAMQNRFRILPIMLFTLGLGTGFMSTPAKANTTDLPVQFIAKQSNVSHSLAGKQSGPAIVTKVVEGRHKTKHYFPKSFRYKLKTPTLRGVKPEVKQAFDKRINTLINAELRAYRKGAANSTEFWEEKNSFPDMSTDKFKKWCARSSFTTLRGSVQASIYRGRYASAVLTFHGANAPCIGLGGLWVEWRTMRSVTIDTITGQFMTLSDFTSNRNNQVNQALDRWYKTVSHEFLKQPKLASDLTVCERPGNVMTIEAPLPCGVTNPTGASPKSKSALVAWQVRDDGVRLTLTAEDWIRQPVISWQDIARLR
jgi:hypothetical protein